MERLMMNIMYDIPSQQDIVEVKITEDCVNGIAEPIIVRKELLVSEPKISGELE